MERFFRTNDMVKVACHDCRGCFSCCEDMGDSIWLDPYDVYGLCKNLNRSFESFWEIEIGLHVEDGLVLPHLQMTVSQTPNSLASASGEDNSSPLAGNAASTSISPRCGFLNEEGRCSIHSFRPGFCRLFPLGRNYEDGSLRYFVLEEACPAPSKSKIKVEKWLGIPKLRDYEAFLLKWHKLTKGLRFFYHDNPDNEAVTKALNMQFLQIFYLTPYDTSSDFYSQFESRLSQMYDYLKHLEIHLEE